MFWEAKWPTHLTASCQLQDMLPVSTMMESFAPVCVGAVPLETGTQGNQWFSEDHNSKKLAQWHHTAAGPDFLQNENRIFGCPIVSFREKAKLQKPLFSITIKQCDLTQLEKENSFCLVVSFQDSHDHWWHNENAVKKIPVLHRSGRQLVLMVKLFFRNFHNLVELRSAQTVTSCRWNSGDPESFSCCAALPTRDMFLITFQDKGGQTSC